MSRNASGFTLIELLVVVSIIGLLSSVVLAGVSSARKKAYEGKFALIAHDIINMIDIARTTKDMTVGEIVNGSDNANCDMCGIYSVSGYNTKPISTSPDFDSFRASNDSFWQKLGFSSTPLDPWGAPLVMDENDYSPNPNLTYTSGPKIGQHPRCWAYDVIYSLGSNSILDTPMTFSEDETAATGAVWHAVGDDLYVFVPFYKCNGFDWP